VVAGVGDQHPAVVEQAQALRLGEARPEPVRAAPDPRADPPYEVVAVQDDQAVMGGVGDEQQAVGEAEGLAGEGQRAGRRWRWHVEALRAVQRALGPVLGDELRQQAADARHVPLTGGDVNDVALRVDEHEGGPGADGVLLPGGQLGVVEDGVVDVVALDGCQHAVVHPLVGELR
jgi:hypothetical protein